LEAFVNQGPAFNNLGNNVYLITYNHFTGLIELNNNQNLENFSQVEVECIDGEFDFVRQDGKIVVHRYDLKNTRFGHISGDMVILDSIQGYNIFVKNYVQ